MYIIGILGSKLLLPGSKYVLWEYVEGLYSIQHSNQYMFYRGAFRMGKGGDAVPLTRFEKGRKEANPPTHKKITLFVSMP
mgnify:CR=1 FL=1